MRKSYMPVSCGFQVRLMSPLGLYPDKDIILDDVCLITTPELCFSIIRIKEKDWGFSEVDSLTPLEIPLFGSLLLPRVGRHPAVALLGFVSVAFGAVGALVWAAVRALHGA